MRSINTRLAHFARWTLAAFAFVGATAFASGDDHAAIDVMGGTVVQREKVLTEIGRYTSAGLELPGLEVHIHEDRSGCGGNHGVFIKAPDRWRINLCDAREIVIRHEVGHAWAAHNLTSNQRDAYVNHWGFESWNATGTAWSSRGSEDAANVLAWGLDPLQLDRNAFLPDGPLAERARAFEMLTGIEAPRLVAG